MKIALVVPTFSYAAGYPSYLAMSDFPVGFAYIAAALKQAGHEVIGLNPNNCPGYPSARDMLYQKMKNMLEVQKPQLVGLGGLCTDYAFIKDAIAICRALAPQLPIVCGGGIVTHDAQYIFNLLKPDFCLIGDAEESIVRLVRCLERGEGFEEVSSLGYWRDDKAVFTPVSFEYSPLESYAFPDYSPFDPEIMMGNSALARWYYRCTRPYPRIMPFVAARGCPFKCTFCVHTQGARYRARPMSDIMEELSQLHERYRFNVLIILDELFAIDRTRMQEFCEGIKHGREHLGWDFDWAFQTHASANLGPSELALAKESGCYLFSYGLESGSPRVLESMKKKTRPEQISSAMRLAAEAGIGMGGNFIFGDMAETPDTIRESLDFFLNNSLDAFCFLTTISPYPGSTLFDFCLKQGIIRDKRAYYETIDMETYNMTSMPDQAYRDWIKGLAWPMNETPQGFVVEPSRVALDTTPREDNGPAPFWLVEVECPHCNRELKLREPLDAQLVVSGQALFHTFCHRCGKRFKVAVKGEGSRQGEAPQRLMELNDLRSAMHRSLATLVSPKEPCTVLYITAEHSNWDQANRSGYAVPVGFEDAFRANGISFLALPTFRELAPGHELSWLSRLKEICDGKQFEQLWIDVVDTNLDDTMLSYLATLAPVRLALVAEPLTIPAEGRGAADMQKRQAHIVHRLRFMTHCLASEERDVAWLGRRGINALWWVPSIPDALIGGVPPFSGEPELPGEALFREELERKPALCRLLSGAAPEPADAELPDLLDQANSFVLNSCRKSAGYCKELLELQAKVLRRTRGQLFGNRLKSLASQAAVVSLPEADLGYLAQVYEGMAAGRPVIAWETPERPGTRALFEAGGEILLVPRTSPETAAAHLERVAGDPAYAERIALNARSKLFRHHSTEARVRQITRWLKLGVEPRYDDGALSAQTACPDREQLSAQYARHKADARRAMEEANMLTASSLCKKIAAMAPDDAENWRNSLRLAILLDDWNEAETARAHIGRLQNR